MRFKEKTKKQDRRTRYTRQTIKETFLELLKQKSFTKITVTEICKNAESGKRPVLAVDADANANLNEVLGVEPEVTLGELREEINRGTFYLHYYDI